MFKIVLLASPRAMKKHFYKDEIARHCLNQHFTVDQIFEHISKKYPQAGRSTVYRNVEELVKEKRLKKIAGAGNKFVYEGKVKPHAHLICQKSKTITDIPLSETILKQVPSNFKIEDLDVNIYGEFI